MNSKSDLGMLKILLNNEIKVSFHSPLSVLCTCIS